MFVLFLVSFFFDFSVYTLYSGSELEILHFVWHNS